MGRLFLVLTCLFVLIGCGAHAPAPVLATAPVHIQHFEGTQLVTFWGDNGAWLPSDDVALQNAAHNAVFGLIKLKAEDMGTQLLSSRAWGGKVIRKDSDGTTYVLVKYEAEVIIPPGTETTLAFNLNSRF